MGVIRVPCLPAPWQESLTFVVSTSDSMHRTYRFAFESSSERNGETLQVFLAHRLANGADQNFPEQLPTKSVCSSVG
eukprot:2923195-Amphidinium_carterae.1